MLKTYLAFPADGRKALCLDPCCGTGEALINICGEQFLYGIELIPREDWRQETVRNSSRY